MLMAELAAKAKADGLSLHEKLDALYWQHGYHREHLINVHMAGSEGMTRMIALMKRFRDHPPETFGGINVAAVRDYLHNTRKPVGGEPEPLDGPTGDMVILDLELSGNYVAVRPSGTEPKIKFYMFAYVPAELLADLETTKRGMAERIGALEADVRALADAV
jgi:phosphoglucomutase/phosphomannomutase